MKFKRRKQLTTITIVLIVLTSLTIFGASDSYHSYTNYGLQTGSSGNNVSAVMLVKLGYLAVNAVITVMGGPPSHVTIYFPNGTSVEVNNYYVVHVHLNKTANFDNQGSSIYFSDGMNLTLSTSHPITAGVLGGIAKQNVDNSPPVSGNSFTFYVSGNSNIQVNAVGESI